MNKSTQVQITQNEEKPIAVEVIAQNIIAISDIYLKTGTRMNAPKVQIQA